MLVALALAISTAAVARASVDADVHAGIVMDPDAVALGGGLLADVGSPGSWYFNPTVDLALADARDMVSLNGDFHYDFTQSRSTSFWMGAGPALIWTDRVGRDADTDVGMNLLAGLGGRSGEVRPFGQLKGTVADNSSIMLSGGIRF
jgi:hypothetical protein